MSGHPSISEQISLECDFPLHYSAIMKKTSARPKKAIKSVSAKVTRKFKYKTALEGAIARERAGKVRGFATMDEMLKALGLV